MKWDEKSLAELGSVSRGRSRHRPRDAAHLYGGPYPFVQTGDIKRAGLYLTEYRQTYSEAGLAQSRMWPQGTLCITIAANIAETALLGFDACFPDSVIGFIADEAKCDPRFIKYRFDTVKQHYQQVSHGAAQDNLSLEKLLAFKIKVPSLSAQRQIADNLSAYENLIENNRRRMALLEQAAQLLYEEWFVRLRFPGREHTTIVHGVPEGWTERRLGELCSEVREHVEPSDVDPDTPYIGLEHIPRRSITASTWGRSEDVTSTKHRYRAGEVLFGKIRPYFHKVAIALTDGVTSSDAIVIRPSGDDVRCLVLLTVSSDQFVKTASQTAREGSKMPRADWKVMRQYSVLLPPRPIMDALNDIVCPILKQLAVLTFQSHRAREARELLLPRLMSGEIEV